jgi:hypothetical protein
MSEELIAQVREEVARTREEIARTREAYADFKTVVADCHMEFIRNREHHERGLRTYERLERFTDDLSRRNERVTLEMIREIRDLRDESLAQRQALLALIDEMRPRREGPPSAN